MDKPLSHGLEGVVVAHTQLSDVDGERGRLVIAGHDVESLAHGISFEELCALLWNVPSASVFKALGEARIEAFSLVPSLGNALLAADGMDALRASMAQLPSSMSSPFQITAAMGTFAAAWMRRREGHAPIAPDASLSHAADYLRMGLGREVRPELVRSLDAYLCTVSDHGMNASTFTARVVISTGSDLVSAVVAAVGALKGPLHGGAPGPVLDMLDAVGTPENALAWLETELRAGRRIMGMGHRIYRVRDPRAAVFERVLERLQNAGVHTGRIALARAVESVAEKVLRTRHPDRPLHANVEFYTAVLLDTIGLPRQAFAPTFAVGRVAGWIAHAREQQAVGKLIRPASVYVGSVPPQSTAAAAQ